MGSDKPLLIEPETLAAELDGSLPPTLLDVRWQLSGPPGEQTYLTGHLPGAVFVDLDRNLAGEPGSGGRHPLPAADAFSAAMRRAGVRSSGPVVVYDEADATAAARAWWLLRYFGHQHVRVLNGGYRAWAAQGRPTSAGAAEPVAPGDFAGRPGQMPLLDAAAAAALARAGVLLDARAAERYRGETEPVDPVAGHIPGALSAPAAASVDAAGRFLDAAALRARFAALGAVAQAAGEDGRPGQPGPGSPGPAGAPVVGAYCGSGVTAAHLVLALAVAGIPAALYVGSWSEWIRDPSRPIATGPRPA